ncbi:MAG TPA: GvpL/GvpF family gas vesicle protein [Trebonia sp.]|jgi:hypothetical protein|nr:GvpL/GvpF family gas vesicle protein [Trebonia sp.]
MTDTWRGVWAYAVTGRGGHPDLSRLTGVGGGGVRSLSAGELTALVSDVDLAEFGEAALRQNLEDIDWLEKVARGHHQVIAAAARLAPVLPLRLATVYSGDAVAAAALAERGAQLAAELDRVGGRVEWGVKAYPVPAGTAGHSAAGAPTADRAREARSATSGGGAGLAYLRRRQTQLTAARESAQSAAAGARAVHAELARQSNATRLHAPQAMSLSGSRLPMLLNAAYLLDAGSEIASRFAAVVAAMASAHPELRLELTGPWPPYSFTGEDKDPPDDDGRRPLPGDDAGPQAAEGG